MKRWVLATVLLGRVVYTFGAGGAAYLAVGVGCESCSSTHSQATLLLALLAGLVCVVSIGTLLVQDLQTTSGLDVVWAIAVCAAAALVLAATTASGRVTAALWLALGLALVCAEHLLKRDRPESAQPKM